MSESRTADPQPVQPLSFPSEATLVAPGSKSEANRLLVAAALSGETMTLIGASPSDDVRYLVAGLKTLGFDAEFVDEPQGTVRVGPRTASAASSGELFCGNAGTALRFLVSVAAITAGDWVITGDGQMQKRPIQPLVAAWQQLGVDVQANNGCPPVRVLGGTCNGSSVTIDPTLSSQFVSSLLLIGSQLRDGLEIRFSGRLASRSYTQLTCSLLARVGVTASLDDAAARVAPSCPSPPAELTVGGDWSSMGTWTCLNHLTGSRVTTSNLASNSGQADEQLETVLESLAASGEVTINVEPIPDQFLNLAVVAAFRDGTTHLTGAANVRIKECDRIAVMARELRKIGADLDEHADGLTVRGGKPLASACIDPEADHRVAMAFALAGLHTRGITIQDPACVTKSYSTFWNDLERVRRQHRAVALVGMRAAGKTTLGRALAKQMGSTFIDTDERFVGEHGPIAAFVQANGWPAFRQQEQRIVADALAPGHVIALGGGAIENQAVRSILAEQTTVVWLRADPELLRQRLANADHRPSLTGASVADEVAEVLAMREPLYRAIATRIVDASLPTAAQLLLATHASP